MIQLSGYETIGPAGFGAGGIAWNVRNTNGVPCVAVRTQAPPERIAELKALRHPHLPEIYSVHRSSEGSVMVMEMIHGASLAVVMGARRWASADEIAHLWRCLADALAALHQRGLVHGDISPANIIISDAGRPTLIDIAGHGGREAGHLGFVPPESEGAPHAPADVWSLARTLQWASGNDPEVCRALERALSADPLERPNARDFALWSASLGSHVPLDVPKISRLAEAAMRSDDEETWLVHERTPRNWWRPVAIAAALGSGLGVTSVMSSGAAVNERAHDEDAITMVKELVATRDRAIAHLSVEDLDSAFDTRSEASAADRKLIDDLAAGIAQIDGFSTIIHEVTLRDSPDDRTVAELRISPSAHERITHEGDRAHVEQGRERCVLIGVRESLIESLTACN